MSGSDAYDVTGGHTSFAAGRLAITWDFRVLLWRSIRHAAHRSLPCTLPVMPCGEVPVRLRLRRCAGLGQSQLLCLAITNPRGGGRWTLQDVL